MHAGAGLHRRIERRQRVVVGEGVVGRIGHGVEHQQQAVGLVDLPAAPGEEQIARHPVVGEPLRRRRGIAELLGQPGAVDDVGQEQGAQLGHGDTLLLRRRRMARSMTSNTASLSSASAAAGMAPASSNWRSLSARPVTMRSP